MNGTTNQPSLLELAKQGNANAIAALINRQLQPKGITAKASLKDGCLQVMLESAQAPNQQSLVAFVRKGITSLGAASIERVMVYGRQTGGEFPSWSQEIELGTQPTLVLSTASSSLNSVSSRAETEKNNCKTVEPICENNFFSIGSNSSKKITITQVLLIGFAGIVIYGLFDFQMGINESKKQADEITKQTCELAAITGNIPEYCKE